MTARAIVRPEGISKGTDVVLKLILHMNRIR